MMREYRLFFVKLPNGYLCTEIVNINKPLSELLEKLCDYVGVGRSLPPSLPPSLPSSLSSLPHMKVCLSTDNPDQYHLSVEGACLSTLRENDTGDVVRVNRTGLNYLADSQILPDQGPDPVPLKTNLSFRMQGISTSRILSLQYVRGRGKGRGLSLSSESGCGWSKGAGQGEPLVVSRMQRGLAMDGARGGACNVNVWSCLRLVDASDAANTSYSSEPPPEEDEFHKCWIGVVQGNHPLSQDDAVKLSALQYQAYFLDRTAVNSVVGFCR